MEKERLKYCIDRYDHFYDSVNNKSSVFLGLSTFIVGGLVAGYCSLPTVANINGYINGLMLSQIIIGIVIMIIVVQAASPYIESTCDSLHFYGSISCLKHKDFCTKSSIETEEKELDDLRTQVHNLACGLSKKFTKLKIAGVLFTFQFILFIPLLIQIINNLK